MVGGSDDPLCNVVSMHRAVRCQHFKIDKVNAHYFVTIGLRDELKVGQR